MFEFITEEKTFLQKLRSGLKKTKDSLGTQLDKAMKLGRPVDESILGPLEEALIQSDIGVGLATDLVELVNDRIKSNQLSNVEAVKKLIHDELLSIFKNTDPWWEKRYPTPAVFMIIGVNGVGKTTSIAKLAHEYKKQGKRVLICAADTFRAAATEQLEIWAKRVGVDILKQQSGSDPAAVVFDALNAAKAQKRDLVLIDTAGRLHTKTNLMQELAKIRKVANREVAGAPHESWLVLDATVGQNGIVQAREFMNITPITGIILTKIDGTAKGGIVVSIAKELGVPIKFLGVGESLDDLIPFDPQKFIDALFEV
ncbi:signal recognition particle-docking protein FtsY [bacterium]|nr:signal recognition particle-docking protein FtsY [bacterium]MCI0605131.1 signal recognition particle-docking protein FtsY [bacterium]